MVINQNSEQTHPSSLPFMLSRVVVRSIPQILADWNQQRHHQHFDGSSNEHLSQLPSSDYLLRSSGPDQSGGQANHCSRWGCGSNTNTNIIQCFSSVHEFTEKLLLDTERMITWPPCNLVFKWLEIKFSLNHLACPRALTGIKFHYLSWAAHAKPLLFYLLALHKWKVSF